LRLYCRRVVGFHMALPFRLQTPDWNHLLPGHSTPILGRALRREVQNFVEEVFEIKRLGSGLAAIRVMGKVEAGYLETAVLSDLLADLEAFQDILRAGLDDILSLNDVVKRGVSQLVLDEPTLDTAWAGQ